MRFISDHIDANQSAAGPQMRIIAAGLPRCATSSLQAALESEYLGYDPCMHMAHVAPHADRLQIVIDAMLEENREKRHKLLHKIFDGYLATTDFPGFWFVDDLMDMYPDAVIILNTRRGGAADWWESLSGGVGFFGKKSHLISCFLYKTDRLHWKVHQVVYSLCMRRLSVPFSAEVFDVHNELVRREARKRGRRVLEWQAEDGWAPICKFLGKEEPPKDVPFPRLNDRKSMMVIQRILITRGLLTWAAVMGCLGASWWYAPTVVSVARHWTRVFAC
jgi:hypothetical protein